MLAAVVIGLQADVGAPRRHRDGKADEAAERSAGTVAIKRLAKVGPPMICVLAGRRLTFAAAAFTLAWTHSVEKTQWEERWAGSRTG